MPVGPFINHGIDRFTIRLSVIMAKFFAICTLISLASASTVVDLGYARYEGHTHSGVTQWLGMRFAAPPVGDLRFAAPQDPLSVEGIQQATKVCTYCLQFFIGSH
jgi:Carboxylesterase type B